MATRRSTYRKQETYIIGKGTVVLARKKHKPHKPVVPAKILDPAEQARIQAETRTNPARWGVNDAALGLTQNDSVKVEGETRTKTKRITRYDCFALLNSRGGLGHGDEGLQRLASVRRFEEKLAERRRLEGLQGSGTGGRPIPVSDRSLMAADCLDYIERTMTPAMYGLLMALTGPSVENGQPVNNWRDVVHQHTGEHYHTAQANLVRAAAESLLLAWQGWDQRERRAA